MVNGKYEEIELRNRGNDRLRNVSVKGNRGFG